MRRRPAVARLIVTWAFVVVVPLLNLRLVCVDHLPSGGRRASVSPATCDELCPRDAAPGREATSETGCVLVAGGCSAGASVVIALPAAPVRGVPRPVAAAMAAMALSPYHAPALTPVSPPPKP